MTGLLTTTLLFLAAAVAGIVGCYLPYLWLKKGASAWLLGVSVSLAGMATSWPVRARDLGLNSGNVDPVAETVGLTAAAAATTQESSSPEGGAA